MRIKPVAETNIPSPGRGKITMENDFDLSRRYICQRCGNCCRWPGFVRLNHSEAPRIAEFLGLDEAEFVHRFTDLLPGRDALGLKSHADGSCVFLEGRNVCRIQEVKPLQCKGFPNAWRFPGWRKVCEAVPEESAETPDHR